jgi:addiction module HigA family antidote
VNNAKRSNSSRRDIQRRNEALSLSSAKAARAIKVPVDRISKIGAGKRNISADAALLLGKLLNAVPLFWMNLQRAYELDVVLASGGLDLAAIVPLGQPVDRRH